MGTSCYCTPVAQLVRRHTMLQGYKVRLDWCSRAALPLAAVGRRKQSCLNTERRQPVLHMSLHGTFWGVGGGGTLAIAASYCQALGCTVPVLLLKGSTAWYCMTLHSTA
jgi:hypothetical protein